MNTKIRNARRARKNRRTTTRSALFQLMSPAEIRQARNIAYEAALAVLG